MAPDLATRKFTLTLSRLFLKADLSSYPRASGLPAGKGPALHMPA